MASAEPKLTEKGKETTAPPAPPKDSPLQLPQGGGKPSGWNANAKAKAKANAN